MKVEQSGKGGKRELLVRKSSCINYSNNCPIKAIIIASVIWTFYEAGATEMIL